MIPRIDAHQHFWHYAADEYGWIDSSMEPLQRDFLPTHLHQEMVAAGIDATVAVQARQTIEETEWLLRLAGECPFIAGVVGWAPLIERNLEAHLDRLCGRPKLRGLRHVLQAEDDSYMLTESFHRGISLLKDRDLVYDILIFERQLPAAIELVDRHPNQRFVLDHLAKPRVRDADLVPWREQIHELARRVNVSCKLSGLVTEANWRTWTMEDLRPYVETALEAFGPDRLLAGSDWPVCTLSAGYGQWWQAVQRFLAELSDDERDGILGGNAIKVYTLNVFDSRERLRL